MADRSEYMREYRKANLARKRAYDREYQKRATALAYRKLHATEARARARAWYYAHREQARARVEAYIAAHPERVRRYHLRSRERRQIQCPFCRNKMHPASTSCENCLQAFGLMCVHNTLCCVKPRHKHCPCHLPIFDPETTHRKVEACSICRHEMKQLNLGLGELFLHAAQFEEAA